MRGPKPHRLLQAIPENFFSISAEDRNRTCVCLVQSQVQRPTVAASVSNDFQHSVRESHPICGLQRPTSRLRAGENCNNESSGGWTRTITRLLNREPPYRLGHTGLSFTKVRTTGFEPAISCTRSTRNTKLSHILITERPVGVEPTLPPWQGSRLPLHHGRICITTKLSKISQRRSAAKSTEPESNPHYLVTTEASCR
jgi:hypothetical protein